ncbi:MAG TPA: Flp family type IVb pilin [Polyangia bacterium]|nr:Flp family type IVb pilin [Polyangia bacterium]
MHSRIRADLRAFLGDDNGATAVEYGLIIAAIAGLILTVVFVLGKKVNNTFNNIQAKL